MMKFLERLWKEDRGQATTEYILILAVVVMIAMKFKTVFGGRMDALISNLTGVLNNAVTEGSQDTSSGNGS